MTINLIDRFTWYMCPEFTVSRWSYFTWIALVFEQKCEPALTRMPLQSVLWTRITFMRIRIRLIRYHPDADPDSDFYLMGIRMWIRIRLFLPWCGFGSGSRSKLSSKGSNPWKSAKIGSYPYIFFWLVICQLVRIPIQLINLMLIRIRIFIWGRCGSRLPKWCGSMRIWIHNTDCNIGWYPMHIPDCEQFC